METLAQRGWVTWPRSHSWECAEVGFRLKYLPLEPVSWPLHVLLFLGSCSRKLHPQRYPGILLQRVFHSSPWGTSPLSLRLVLGFQLIQCTLLLSVLLVGKSYYDFVSTPDIIGLSMGPWMRRHISIKQYLYFCLEMGWHVIICSFCALELSHS